MASKHKSKWPTFDGKAEEYELWEERMLCCMHGVGLKETILREPPGDLTAVQKAIDAKLNADAYCELAPLLDNTSLGLIFRDTKDKGRESLRVLREHYIGKGRPRIVTLYTTMTALKKADNETVTEYIIRAEQIITALRSAGEAPSEGLMMAMVMRGLPEKYKPFTLMVTHGDAELTLGQFKAKLRNFEASEESAPATDETGERVLKAQATPKKKPAKRFIRDGDGERSGLVCWRCGGNGHQKDDCTKKVWCSFCKSKGHTDKACTKKDRGDGARCAHVQDGGGHEAGRGQDSRAAAEVEDYTLKARTEDTSLPGQQLQTQRKGLIVDTGASSHIINDKSKFKNFDGTFKPERHSMELADGKRTFRVAQGRGEAQVCLIDSEGRRCQVTLENALYIPSYPQELFSVKSATTNGAKVFFEEAKSDAVQATEKYLADVAPYGTVKCIRSDKGTEFTSKKFQTLLRKNKIRHETSCPYSPHQNGTAEREGRTLFEMARCMLIDSDLPKCLWHYAIQEAAHTRNRCFNKHMGTTAYSALTGKKCNLARMHKFGSMCYAYQQDKGKLDSRCEKGRFVGHDKGSPAYLVYYPDKEKVQKHRLVKFVTKTTCESETQTQELEQDPQGDCEERVETPQPSVLSTDVQTDDPQSAPEDDGEKHPRVTSHASDSGRYPSRERKPPGYLRDYTQDDSTLTSVDYCYRAVCGVPLTFKEAMTSTESEKWGKAMDEEIKSLEDNQTFALTKLPKGRKTVGGRWVYSIKSDTDGHDKYKARFVAKGYSQRAGIDYGETFSPTANLTNEMVADVMTKPVSKLKLRKFAGVMFGV
ncbi:hypothetical protein SKAU_G00138540 [Synaphobranchus kaupii]|uniref:Polyprotein n=1 Tax=Synaphobranchus kaupii TaxID=118154 RepID=A0A9Q1FRZ1_SYNKA|nr:hypothetical protein SKAU_G00138540 [Synaphobranchus kaupii]